MNYSCEVDIKFSGIILIVGINNFNGLYNQAQSCVLLPLFKGEGLGMRGAYQVVNLGTEWLPSPFFKGEGLGMRVASQVVCS